MDAVGERTGLIADRDQLCVIEYNKGNHVLTRNPTIVVEKVG